MALLGSSIDPRLFQQDYSGYVRAGEMQAQSIANLGERIGSAIKDFGEEKKKINQDIAKGKSALQFAKANYPELAGRIDEIGKIFSDVNVSKAEQAAAGSQMGEFVTAMIRGQEFNTEVGLKEKELGIREAENIANILAEQNEIQAKANQRTADSIYFGGKDIAVTKDGFGNIYDPVTGRRIVDIADYEAGGENFSPPSSQSNQDTGDLLQRSLELDDPTFGSQEASDVLFPDGVAPQGDPMLPETPTTTGVPKVDGVPTPRGTPRTTGGSETYRPFTPEEVSLYGSQGQVSSTGKVYPIRPPSGTRFTTNPDGSVTYETDAGLTAKAEGVAKAQEQMKDESFRLNQANTEEAFKLLDTAGTNNPVFAAGKALMADVLPASETGELAGFYERINDENSFIKMNAQRASSPTGGAAGSMTEKEWPKYQGRFSPLKVNAKKDTIAKSLSLNLLNAFEATNGTPDDIIKALDEKKIDQATYDNYVSDYIRNRQIARVNANGVEGESYDWTRLNKKLLSKSTIFEAPVSSSPFTLSPEAEDVSRRHPTGK